MKTIVFALLAISLAAPAVAGDNDKQQANATAKKKPHLICRRDTGATGTHMSPLVCKTAQEWDALSDAGSGKLGTLNHGQAGGSGQATLPSQ